MAWCGINLIFAGFIFMMLETLWLSFRSTLSISKNVIELRYSLNVKNLPLEMHSTVNAKVNADFVCARVVASVEYHHIFFMKIVGEKSNKHVQCACVSATESIDKAPCGLWNVVFRSQRT